MANEKRDDSRPTIALDSLGGFHCHPENNYKSEDVEIRPRITRNRSAVSFEVICPSLGVAKHYDRVSKSVRDLPTCKRTNFICRGPVDRSEKETRSEGGIAMEVYRNQWL